MKQSHLFVIGIYGDKEAAFDALADRHYRERTGIGETRNPLVVEDLLGYTPPITRKNNESPGDYRLRQLDYFLKHTRRVKLPWYKRIKIVDQYKLIWVK